MLCEICEICDLDDAVEKHHLIPKQQKKSNPDPIIIRCCYDCAKQVHMLFNNKELAEMSLEELLEMAEMQTYIKWKMKHPGTHGHKMSSRVKDWQKYHR